MAPMIIVCRHLLDGTSKEWVELPDPDEECSDFLCPECFERGPDRLTTEELAAVCMHCARRMREACP
jgi:hypothetical protein